MMGWYGGYGWIGMAIGMVLMLLFFAAAVLFVVWVVRQAFPGSANSSQNPPAVSAPLTAKEILKARYAKGELTREEYQNMLADIER
jgi:putative membrane protein